MVEGGVGRYGLLGGLADHGADLLVGDHQVEVGVGRAQDGDVQVPVGEQGQPVLAWLRGKKELDCESVTATNLLPSCQAHLGTDN